jgi:hypothetical protein
MVLVLLLLLLLRSSSWSRSQRDTERRPVLAAAMRQRVRSLQERQSHGHLGGVRWLTDEREPRPDVFTP